MLGIVTNVRRRQRAIPVHFKRDGCPDGGNRRDGGIWEPQIARKPKPISQRISQIVVIKDREIVHAQSRPLLVEINIDCIVRHPNHPEHLIRVNVHIVVVDLVSEIGRSDRTGVQVKSNKGERAFVMVSITSNERPLTEAHVCPKGEGHAGPGRRVGSCAAASNVG